MNNHFNKAKLFFGKGLEELRQKNFMKAKKFFELVIKETPRHFEALHSIGRIYCTLGMFDKGLIYLDKALDVDPNYLVGYYDKAVALQELGHFDLAVYNYEKVIKLDPNYFWAHYKKANLFQLLNRLKDAIYSYEYAIKIKPNFSEIYYNYALVLYKVKRFKESIANYSKAINLKKNFAEAYCNRGIAFKDVNQMNNAIIDFHKSINIKPDYALAYANLGDAYEVSNLTELAIFNYKKALDIDVNSELVLGSYLHNKMKVCDWSNLDFYNKKIEKKIKSNIICSAPFPLLSIFTNPELHLMATKNYVIKKYPENNIFENIEKYKNKKIKIGYFSSDFHEHPVSYLALEFLEACDKNIFEIVAFSFLKNNSSEFRDKLIKVFDKFIDVENESDEEIVKLSRKLKIDIAIDMNGHTSNNRFKIFSYRAAPIQVNFLGYPGTSGANYFDYIIADNTVIPKNFYKYYTEKICILPNSFLPFSIKIKKSKKIFYRKNIGISENNFVFSSFNSSHKIKYETFSCWMNILKSVNNSVLWLTRSNQLMEKNLKKEAEKLSVDPARIIFSDRLDLVEDHLERQNNADLLLDVYPYGGHTTSINALYYGLPVLTCCGKSFASRVAASLLTSVGVTELITHSLKEYESKAIELATNLDKLQEIKNKLIRSRTTSSLFRPSVFAKNIEVAFQQMHKRYISGLKPDHFEVQ